jgi:hypothetical protein
MQDFLRITNRYLVQKTNYAIQLSGKWGIGKTHYVKNVLIPKIEKTEAFADFSKKYVPIYISLFGIKSLEDIDTKIVFELAQYKIIGNNTFLSVSKHIASIFFKGFMNYNKLGKPDEFIAESKSLAKSVLDFRQLVLILDDLERKSKSVYYIEIIGFINHLVDLGIKIFIIANDDKLKEFGEENYKDIKSKTIGISVEYVPDNNEVLESVLSDYDGSPLGYRNFLMNNIHIIKEFATLIDFNYRNLKYSLDLIQSIYSTIENNKSAFKNNEWEIYVEKREQIFKFCLVVSDLFKNSEISSSDEEHFYNKYSPNFNWWTENDKKTPSKFDNFIKKYKFSNFEYYMFPSIYLYLTMNQDFSFDRFKEEFIEKFNLNEESQHPHSLVLRELDYLNIPHLSDARYKQLTKQILDYAKEGLYKPGEYLTVYHFCERFDNILSLNLELAYKNVLIGFKKSIKKFDVTKLPTSYFRMSVTSTNSDELRKLAFLMSDSLEKINEKSNYINAREVLDSIFNSNDFYYNVLKSYEIDFSYTIEHNLFEIINLKDTVEGISNIRNTNNLNLFEDIFKKRYLTVNYSGAPETAKKYAIQLKKLGNLISKLKTRYIQIQKLKNQKLRSYQLKLFLERLENIYYNAKAKET